MTSQKNDLEQYLIGKKGKIEPEINFLEKNFDMSLTNGVKFMSNRLTVIPLPREVKMGEFEKTLVKVAKKNGMYHVGFNTETVTGYDPEKDTEASVDFYKQININLGVPGTLDAIILTENAPKIEHFILYRITNDKDGIKRYLSELDKLLKG